MCGAGGAMLAALVARCHRRWWRGARSVGGGTLAALVGLRCGLPGGPGLRGAPWLGLTGGQKLGGAGDTAADPALARPALAGDAGGGVTSALVAGCHRRWWRGVIGLVAGCSRRWWRCGLGR